MSTPQGPRGQIKAEIKDRARAHAKTAINAAISAGLQYLGVPKPTADRIAPYVLKIVAVVLSITLTLSLVLLGALLSVTTAKSSASYNALPSGIRIPVENAAQKYDVPPKLIMALAQTQTNYGATSPYANDTSNRSAPPAGVSASTFPEVTPAIGDASMSGQGLGMYLLSPAIVSEADIDAQNWTEASLLVAQLMRKGANQLLSAGVLAPSTPESADNFWSQVVNGLPVVDPLGGAGDCTADPAHMGEAITKIWSCELDRLAAGITVAQRIPGGAVSIQRLGSYQSRSTILSEALGVAWSWSSSKGATKTWLDVAQSSCNESSTFAGVFPLSKLTAKKYGATDRCDPVSNIRAAARAVIEDFNTPTESVAGMEASQLGWRVLEWSLGSSSARQRFLEDGPWSPYRPSTECENVTSTWIATLRTSTNASVFDALGKASGSPSDAQIATAWSAFNDGTVGAPRLDSRCADPATGRTPSVSRYIGWAGQLASGLLDQAGEGTTATDTSSYTTINGLVTLAQAKSEKIVEANPPATPAVPRLSADAITISYAFVQPSSSAGTGLGMRVVGAAIALGGLVGNDPRSGSNPYLTASLVGSSGGGIGISFQREDPNDKKAVNDVSQLTILTCGAGGVQRYSLEALSSRWEMLCDSAGNDGTPMHINSAWRSAAQQIALTKTNPANTTAAPGTSPHEKAAAVDLETGTPWAVGGDAGRQFAWLHSVVGCFNTSDKSYVPLPTPFMASQYVAAMDAGSTPCPTGTLPVKRAQTFGVTPLCLNHYSKIESWSDRAVILCRKEPMKSSPTGFSREPWHFDIGIIVASTGIATSGSSACLPTSPIDPSNQRSVALAVKSIWKCKMTALGLDRQPPRSAGGYDASWASNFADQISSAAVLVAFCESSLRPASGANNKYRGVFQLGDAEMKSAGMDPALWADAKLNISAAADYWISTFRTPGALEGWRPWAVVNTQWYGASNTAKVPVIGRFVASPPSPLAGQASGVELPNWAQDPANFWGPSDSCWTTVAVGKPMKQGSASTYTP